MEAAASAVTGLACGASHIPRRKLCGKMRGMGETGQQRGNRMNRHPLKNLCALLLFALASFSAQSQESERPPWLSDEVISAAMNIGMSEEQLGPFRESVSIFLEAYRDAARRIIRRGDAGIETSVQRARSSLARQMDKRMQEILTAEQMVPYQDYRAALLDAVTPDP